MTVTSAFSIAAAINLKGESRLSIQFSFVTSASKKPLVKVTPHSSPGEKKENQERNTFTRAEFFAVGTWERGGRRQPVDVMYRVTMAVSNTYLSTTIWLFHCLPDSAWAAANWAEIGQHCGTSKNKVNAIRSLTTMVTLYVPVQRLAREFG